MNKEKTWFEKGILFSKRYFSWLATDSKRTQDKISKYFTQEYMETLNFTGLNVEPIDILRFTYTGALIAFIFAFLLDLIVIISYGANIVEIDASTIILMLCISVFFPLLVMNLLANYPKTYARYEKIHSLGDIPEVLSYLVMYLKLVPNLENSIKFAASESSTSLSKDLRKMLWDMEIRTYHGVSDALSNFANYWGKWSEHFKRSLHLIRSSIQESDEAQRVVTLDRALDVGLDGTRELMNDFASKLHQPTMFIYSIGIMIPLSLIAMLPAAGLVGMKITIFQIFFVYDILLPLILFLYTRKILLSRPATFNPPVIPSDHPDLVNINKNRRLIISILAGVVVSIPGIFFMSVPIFAANTNNHILRFIADPKGLNNYLPVTLFIIWGVATAVTLYSISVYRPYKKVRDNIKQIEKEFSDALYILGKRISEEKSPEESFMYAAKTMEGSKIADVFSQTGYNLIAMHTNIRDALFSQEFGSLKYIYSDRIKAIMKLFVEGIQKSQRAVSVSIIRVADHLKELQQVEIKIKDTLYNLTSTLRSTAAIFAPLIAGVTLAITKLISNILSSMADKMPGTSITGGTSSVLSSVTESFSLENVRPEYFALVVGIYVIELVFLLTRFTNGIDDGDDKAEYMYLLGKVMPTAITVLTFSIIVGQIVFSSIVRTI